MEVVGRQFSAPTTSLVIGVAITVFAVLVAVISNQAISNAGVLYAAVTGQRYVDAVTAVPPTLRFLKPVVGLGLAFVGGAAGGGYVAWSTGDDLEGGGVVGGVVGGTGNLVAGVLGVAVGVAATFAFYLGTAPGRRAGRAGGSLVLTVTLGSVVVSGVFGIALGTLVAAVGGAVGAVAVRELAG